MKASLFKRILCALMALITVALLGACAKKDEKVAIEPMPIEEVPKITFDFLGGEDVMPLSGYYGPYVLDYSVNGDKYPDYLTDDIMQKIADSGINLLHYSGGTYQPTRESTLKLLELGEKYKVGIFPVDQDMFSREFHQGVTTIEEEAKIRSQFLERYDDYPALCGFYVIDEPGADYYHKPTEYGRNITELEIVSKVCNEIGVVPSINLLPPITEEDYEPWNRYVREYIELCDPQYISYDCYPYINYGSKEVYFYSMDRMQSFAKEYNLPFWSYIQVGDETSPGAYEPNEGQYNWNINTTLAYGVKGLEFYFVIQPYYYAEQNGNNYEFCGLIGAQGNKTQWWYYTKNINNHIAAIDSVLMNSSHKGIIISGDEATRLAGGLTQTMEGESWRELKSVEGNAMIGCFNYQGKTALYVVNFEEHFAQHVTLNLQDAYNMSITQNAETTTVNTNKLILDLKAGEGVLVVFD